MAPAYVFVPDTEARREIRMSECRWLPSDTLTIQIRPDLSVYVVNLPEDLTPEESRKIGRVVGSLIDDGLLTRPRSDGLDGDNVGPRQVLPEC